MAELSIRAVVGLGNPGPDYARTRHNAGFWFADRLAAAAGVETRREARFHGEFAKLRIAGGEVLLLKPSTFMNRSGIAVQALASYYKIETTSILVAHDELDLPVGSVKFKRGGGHGGHNGLRDIHRHMGESYPRLRIGIGHPGHKEQVLGYVLGCPSTTEQKALDAALAGAVTAFDILMRDGWDKALQTLHTSFSAP